jgi:hypothetical protein
VATTLSTSVEIHLKTYAQEVTDKFALPIDFNREDQLKPPTDVLFKGIGAALNLEVKVVTEVQTDQLGRPDMGIAVKGLLAGHVELKAPGKGADPNKFRGNDREQWERFKNLPNLIYTDGNDWALYRSGELVGKTVRLSGDVTAAGQAAIAPADAEAILALMQDFLCWEPIVPPSPSALAKMLAPLCRLLRADVLTALQNPESNLSNLAADWRKYLFPDADDFQFADAYAQTLTYALLLARLSGPGAGLSIPQAVTAIRTGHRLLADALKILGDPMAQEEIETPVSVLERVIGAVDPAALTRRAKGDPWLYFYENFLAAYDPKMRKDRGVYYTPVEVVQAQVRLVAQLLEERFDADYAFVNDKVITLDPGAGTGTYILAALQHGLARVEQEKGPGMRANFATQAARNLHAFELLVGPYAVAHLRLTQQILAEGGQMPPDGVHVYLTDTLESPYQSPPSYDTLYKELGEEYKRAQRVKASVPVLVVIGNPPYDRQQIEAEDACLVRRKGGWVRFSEPGKEGAAILIDFLKPLAALGWGVHAKNLYNDYVYFWRWALWKVFENKGGPGIVSFITASSYLRGPGFAGMRQVMRETLDDLWIIDLEGDILGTRKTENVFAIQTPVAIAVGVRYGEAQPEQPAAVHYTRISGTEREKLKTLALVNSFGDLPWRDCLPGWTDTFLPTSDKPYWSWPLVTDLFPWQVNGVKAGRSWPVAPDVFTLQKRWRELIKSKDRRTLFKDRPTGRKVHLSAPLLPPLSGNPLPSIESLPDHTPPPEAIRFSYRSFDRQWLLADSRLLDRPSPDLWRSHSNRQVYLTSLLTEVVGEGPAAISTSLIPDLHHFRGSFGGAHTIPLWRDAAATEPNITAGILDVLARSYGRAMTAEDLFAYCYAVLSTAVYVQNFWEELVTPGLRLPITRDLALFARTADLGRRLLWLHTFGERFVPPGHKPGRIPPGKAKCLHETPGDPDKYPEKFFYDLAMKQLHVGEGVFGPVCQEVWEFSISGFQVVQHWLSSRMKKGAGKKSSPLDQFRPESWHFDEELQDLLWVLEHTVDLWPALSQALTDILDSELFTAQDFPEPKPEERMAKGHLPLLGAVAAGLAATNANDE